MSIKVNKEKCPQNHLCPCVRICPKKAISQNNFEAPEVDQELCIDCGLCVRSCPFNVFSKNKI